MTVKEKIMAQGALLWRFLGFFQPPLLRSVHVAVIVFVLLQFLTSMSMEVTLEGPSPLAWIHIIIGMALCLLVLALVTLSIKKRGLRNFFPYLWGDMGQITKDVAAIRGGKLIIAPRPKGLACVVQGLGMGALTMSLITGLWLFRSWQMGEISHAAANLHGIFVFLLLAYAIGHGGMALGHFFFWKKTAAKKQ